MNYQHTLDPTSKKFTCPACNKKRFVRYINTETGEYLPHEYGRCDRETSCAYHCKPSVTPGFSQGNKNAAPLRLRVKKTTKGSSSSGSGEVPKAEGFIPFPLFRQTLPNQKQNNFVQFLKTIFPRETVKHLILTYFIGASRHWPGATIFWQIDKHEKVHTGQVILYDKQTGKRIQKPYPHITWVHSLLIKQGKLKSFNLQQCLFGEHQLIDSPTNKPIAIVESAKSAIIMTGFYPNYIWMATNGSANLNATMLQQLISRNIILYPDLGQYNKWNKKAMELMRKGFKISTSNLLEKKATPEDHKSGLDIADYFINSKRGFSPPLGDTQRGSRGFPPLATERSPSGGGGAVGGGVLALSPTDKIFNSLTSKHPIILQLIDTLDLINPNTNKPYNLVN